MKKLHLIRVNKGFKRAVIYSLMCAHLQGMDLSVTSDTNSIPTSSTFERLASLARVSKAERRRTEITEEEARAFHRIWVKCIAELNSDNTRESIEQFKKLATMYLYQGGMIHKENIFSFAEYVYPSIMAILEGQEHSLSHTQAPNQSIDNGELKVSPEQPSGSAAPPPPPPNPAVMTPTQTGNQMTLPVI